MSKEDFKKFVKKNPSLVKYVENDQMTWQKFYELYDLYGEDNEVWKKYIDSDYINYTDKINDIISFVKKIDLEKVQSTVENIEKVVDIFQGLNSKDNLPLYKRFDK